jgi:hypothetical protein
MEHQTYINDKDSRSVLPKLLAILITVVLVAGVGVYIVYGSAI